MLKRLILAFIIPLVLAGFLFGCVQKQVGGEEPIRIAYAEWPPDMMSYLANELGLFEKHGVEVELFFASNYEVINSYREADAVDVWAYTLLDFITEYAEGTERDSQIFLIQDFSNGADAVMSMEGNGIDELSDLSGKKVGVEKGTIGDFFLDILLEMNNMSLDELQIISMSADDVVAALVSGEIDAGVTYEPNISQLLNEGGQVIIDSSNESGLIVDVYVADKESVRNNFDAYRNLTAALLEAGEYINENPEKAAEIISSSSDINASKEEILKSFSKLTIPDLSDNQIMFNRSSNADSLYILARLAQHYLEGQAVLNKYFDVETLINPSIIDSL